MKLTIVSCFYKINTYNFILKHEWEKYIEWITKFLTIVKNFNLVIFMDKYTYDYICECKLNEIIESKSDKIKIVIKEKKDFYCYQYKDYFITNNSKIKFDNYEKMSWEMNLVWAEKLNFVSDVVAKKYFDTEYYAWCDIGYFRNEPTGDLSIEELKEWGNNIKLFDNPRDIDKIIYGSPHKNFESIKIWNNLIKKGVKFILDNNINAFNETYPRSVAGGFFILHKTKINWWCQKYYSMLSLYVTTNSVLYHDETILSICAALYPEHFKILIEINSKFDNTWRLFQRYLLDGYYNI
jgi:hypothetical protein